MGRKKNGSRVEIITPLENEVTSNLDDSVGAELEENCDDCGLAANALQTDMAISRINEEIKEKPVEKLVLKEELVMVKVNPGVVLNERGIHRGGEQFIVTAHRARQLGGAVTIVSNILTR